MSNKRVLVFSDYFYPAYKAGGPIRSITNLTRLLQRKVSFSVVSSNTDLDNKALSSVEPDLWLPMINGTSAYYSSDNGNIIKVLRGLDLKNFDCIYLNSFFSFSFSILVMLYLRFIGYKGGILLAPRGELTTGALKKGWIKKKVYLSVFKILFRRLNITFHFTSPEEVHDGLKYLGRSIKYIDIPNMHEEIEDVRSLDKEVRCLNLTYLSRVTEKKNLKTVLNSLLKLGDDITVIFKIAGEVDSAEYWEECKDLIKSMPKNVTVEYLGSLDRNNSINLLMCSHAFILPTFNENFGHAIVEAGLSGCIPIISNQTPWSDVKNHGGYVLECLDVDGYTEAIYEIANYSSQEFESSRINSQLYFKKKLDGNAKKIEVMFDVI